MNNKKKIIVKGKFIYETVGEYNNSGNTERLTREVTYKSKRSYKAVAFREDVASQLKRQSQSAGTRFETSVSYGIVSASVSGEYSITDELEEMIQSTERYETTIKESEELIDVQKYYIGPDSQLYIYYRSFRGPGIKAPLMVPITRPTKMPEAEKIKEVNIEVILAPVQFIKGFKIVSSEHGADAPHNRVRARNGNSDNINHGQDGHYVWIVPETTNKAAEALTHIDLVVTRTLDRRHIDIATGDNDAKYKDFDIGRIGNIFDSDTQNALRAFYKAWSKGEDYRYLIPQQDPNSGSVITNLELIRSTEELKDFEKGYGHTTNINANRDGDWLYLTWKSQLPVCI
ncbi:hypothetical protein H0H92_014153 [Tricholoma furcatifolium]|nr:hypothetical protein H0H92_014153 [Tricholoma furcatifolium]